jgi:hypothetical protein
MVLLQHFGATSSIEKAKWEKIATKIGSLKPRAATTLAGKTAAVIRLSIPDIATKQ